MQHWHCDLCHHEWDGSADSCGWCGSSGHVLSDEPWFTECDPFNIDEALIRRYGPFFEGYTTRKKKGGTKVPPHSISDT